MSGLQLPGRVPIQFMTGPDKPSNAVGFVIQGNPVVIGGLPIIVELASRYIAQCLPTLLLVEIDEPQVDNEELNAKLQRLVHNCYGVAQLTLAMVKPPAEPQPLEGAN